MYSSYNGLDFHQTDQFTWAVEVAKVGVFAHKQGGTISVSIGFRYIHLDQVSGWVIDDAGTMDTTTLIDEDFADLSNWDLDNSGAATIVANTSPPRFTMSITDADDDSARLLYPSDVADVGMLMRVRTTHSGAPQGFFCPATRQYGPIVPPYGYAAGYVMECNTSTNTVRFVSTQGTNYVGPLFSGIYSFHSDDDLTGFDLDGATDTWIRLESFGPVLRFRFWLEGEPEPDTWDRTIFDMCNMDAHPFGIVLAANRTTDAVDSADIYHLEAYAISNYGVVGPSP
jgi:hypothetical protein